MGVPKKSIVKIALTDNSTLLATLRVAFFSALLAGVAAFAGLVNGNPSDYPKYLVILAPVILEFIRSYSAPNVPNLPKR